MEVAIGVFGGAFNPPHFGHLALAREAVTHFALARLLVRVVADPGHREVSVEPEVRLLLARLAFAGIPEAEVALDQHSRTVDSLEALGLPDPLFLVGADEFASFPTWKAPERVLELSRLGVATRPGSPRHRLDAVLDTLSHPERVTFFPIEPLPISSSEIRGRVREGRPIAGLVPPEVAVAIDGQRLYRGPGRL